MPGLRRYEVALEAEEEIYWGCFYFFPWLRMWRRERSVDTATQHYLLYSALPTATVKQATEEGHPGGTAGG